MNNMIVVSCLFVVAALTMASSPDEKSADRQPPKLLNAKLDATKNVHTFGKTILCGQPTRQAFGEAKKRGIKRVVTLRTKGEVDWNEAGTFCTW